MEAQVLNDIVRDYFSLFVNRRAYTMQATRPDPETGRHYYYRPRAKGTVEPVGKRTIALGIQAIQFVQDKFQVVQPHRRWECQSLIVDLPCVCEMTAQQRLNQPSIE